MCQTPQQARSIDSILFQAVTDEVITPQQAAKIRSLDSYHSSGQRFGFDISTICEIIMPLLPVLLPILLTCFDDCPDDEQVRQILRDVLQAMKDRQQPTPTPHE